MAIETDFYTDPLCVWALVAEPKIDAVQAEFGDRLVVRHRVLPVFGSIDARFSTGVWAKGGIDARVAATARAAWLGGFKTVSGAGWRHEPASSWGPSAVAAGVRQLEDAGEVPAGSTREALRGLRHRFFLDDVDVTRRDEQRRVLEEAGLPADRVFRLIDDGPALARLAEAVERRATLRIDGSPTWIFDGGRARLFGNVGLRVVRSTIQALLDGEESGCSTC